MALLDLHRVKWPLDHHPPGVVDIVPRAYQAWAVRPVRDLSVRITSLELGHSLSLALRARPPRDQSHISQKVQPLWRCNSPSADMPRHRAITERRQKAAKSTQREVLDDFAAQLSYWEGGRDQQAASRLPAAAEYVVPVDPMDDLQCDSCQ